MAVLSALTNVNAQVSDNGIIMLDLSKSTTPLTFDEVNGMWNDNFDEDITEIESQVFSFVHGCFADYDYWYGFTASNSIDNSYQANTLLYQYSNMARGGILLNEDGTIMTNEFGAPQTGSEMPYIVGYPKSEITFNTNKTYELVGGYFNLNSYTFYSILYGDGFARAFTDGDELILTAHGIDADGNEKTLDICLAAYSNGALTASTGWKYVDLSSLGIVEEIFFTMSSTDSGQWGMNTPGYFCLDKLMVKEAESSSALTSDLGISRNITYDSNTKTIILPEPAFATVYDASGRIVLSSSDRNSFSASSLPAGIYIVKSGNYRLKFAR